MKRQYRFIGEKHFGHTSYLDKVPAGLERGNCYHKDISEQLEYQTKDHPLHSLLLRKQFTEIIGVEANLSCVTDYLTPN